VFQDALDDKPLDLGRGQAFRLPPNLPIALRSGD